MNYSKIIVDMETYIRNTYNKMLKIEFVADLHERYKDICANDIIPTTYAYSATSFTGHFIPNTITRPAYILVKTGRDEKNTIKTLFHEFQHAKDHFLFLSLSNDNIEKMIESDSYVFFQIVSEYFATKNGYEKAFELCDINIDKGIKINAAMNAGQNAFHNSNQTSRYMKLISYVQYFAVLKACCNFDINFSTIEYMKGLDNDSSLADIVFLLWDMEEINLENLNQFNKLCSDYIKF